MEKLVSIIIPCFNAQRWLSEAIDSCLQQTYPNIEIIVIDDGSTDNSLEIIKSYKDRIIWDTGINKGGNYARNKGFALSKGEYIQYLDADDYILPEKIANQVQAFEKMEGDVIYSDWRYKKHLSDGSSYLDSVEICGPKNDFLESLLSNDQWVPLVGLLFTREAIINKGCWDESLKAAQDRDFLMTIAINGGKFVYQPGCDSIYRRHDDITVSTSCRLRWLNSHSQVMERAEKKLFQLGKLSQNYRQALAKAYFKFGRDYLYDQFPNINHDKYLRFLQSMEKALVLFPEFESSSRSKVHYLIQKLFGCRMAEIMTYYLTRFKLSLRSFSVVVKEKNSPDYAWNR
ncbi:glycosyltransferase [Aerosakkonemataceae cyanobacterium BLCC-F154]|uniref:Glycosyltransferase n=1 Tax=Floridaenema fluviatile BLCC-F154 TaxID=3153640 RepID=A0ABV4YA49_9CYAN